MNLRPGRRATASTTFLAVSVLLTLTACAGSGSTAQPSAGPAGDGGGPACPVAPVPGRSDPPRRVVTMDGNAAAVFQRLGLADRVVGTASPQALAAFTGPERAALDRIPVLDTGTGNAEVVIGARPDLVTGTSRLSFGGFDGTPSVERLRQVGAEVLAGCPPPADGPVTDIAPTLAYVRQVAELFGVTGRGERVVAEIEADLAAARAVRPATPVRVLVVSSAPVTGQPLRTRGGRSVVNGIVTLAGGENLAAGLRTDFASLSAEVVAARDPQALVVLTGFAEQSEADLLAALRSGPVVAFAGAVLAGLLVFAMARVRGRLQPGRMVLAGVAIGQLLAGVTSFLLLRTQNADAQQQVLFWMLGSLAGARWDLLAICTAVVGSLSLLLWWQANRLNLLVLGDAAAAALGADTTRIRMLLFGATGLLTGTVVAVSGSIGFVGLVVPNLARLLFGADHRRTLPVVALLGALVVVWSDLGARLVLAPTELPIGILTAAIGVPFFLAVLRRGTTGVAGP